MPAVSPAPGETRFSFLCRRCGTTLEGRTEQVGRSGRCPTCGATFTVPPRDTRTGQGSPAAARRDEAPVPMHAYAAAGENAPQIVRRPDGSQAIQCVRCRAQSPIDAEVCTRCGTPFTLEGAERVAEEIGGIDPSSSAALVWGILAVPCLGLTGPLAIWFGFKALRRPALAYEPRGPRTRAIIGLLLGVLGLIEAAYVLTH
ncbi:MAG: hypothetical protein U1A27_06820 [Phycisphaerae bacterium]